MLTAIWTYLRARAALVLGVLGALGAGATYLLGRSKGQAAESTRTTEANRDAIAHVAVDAAEAKVRDNERAAELARAKAEVAATAAERHAQVPTTPEEAERQNAATSARLAAKRGQG